MLSLRMDQVGGAEPVHEGGSPFHALMADRMAGERTLLRLDGGTYVVAVAGSELDGLAGMGVAPVGIQAVGEVVIVELRDVADAMRVGVCARLLRFPGDYRHPRQSPAGAPVVPSPKPPSVPRPAPVAPSADEPSAIADPDRPDGAMLAEIERIAGFLGRPVPAALARGKPRAVPAGIAPDPGPAHGDPVLQMARDLPEIERLARCLPARARD